MKIKDMMLYLPRGVYSSLLKSYRANLDDKVKDKILEDGMYHFVPNEDVGQAILDSEYLKPASGLINKYITSYGTPVACLFCGRPDIDNYSKNVTGTKTENNPYVNPAMVATAIKISPTEKEELKDYKIRNMSDSAILYEGYCVLPHEKIQMVKMVPDLVRDEENTPIMDDNGEFKIEFREARKEELIPESNYYLAQKDYLDYIKQKSIELGYSKNSDTIIGKANNYINNIIDQGRMEKDETKSNIAQNAKGNMQNFIKKITSIFKNLRTLKIGNTLENTLENLGYNRNSPYQNKRMGQYIARNQAVKGIEQIDIKDGLNILKEDNINQYIKNKYNTLQENLSSRNGIHGEGHSKRVVLNAMMIAQKEDIFYGFQDNDNKVKDILITAAAFHDIGRIGNVGPHAKRSAKKVGKMNLEFSDGTKYSQEDKKILMAIIEAHEGDKDKIFDVINKYNITDNRSFDIARKLSVILKDADALDRARLDFGMLGQSKTNLNPKYLITNSAKSMIAQSYDLITLTDQVSMNEILKDNQKPDKQKFDESIRVAPGTVDERKAINQVQDMIKTNDKIQEDFDYTN